MRLDDLPASVRGALEDAKRGLAERFGQRLIEVRLFGSFARGDATPESDVDVMVVVDRLASSIELLDATDIVAGAGVDHEVLLEALVMDSVQLSRQRRWETALVRALDADGVAV